MFFFQNGTNTEEFSFDNCQTSSYTSVGLLLASIISGRFGVWLTDITICQVLQEKVQEEHRGIIGGVQNSLNSIMDTVKFVFVIVLPNDQTFGWLILASFVFVSIGTCSYLYYAIFQHDKIPDTSNKHSNEIAIVNT